LVKRIKMKLTIQIQRNDEHDLYPQLQHSYYLLDKTGKIMSTTDKRLKDVCKLSFLSAKILDMYFKLNNKYPAFVYGLENEMLGFIELNTKALINNIIIPE
jgi:hypothetical protein